MSTTSSVDEGCGAFFRLPALAPQQLHRFVIGEDPAPRAMPREELEAELADPFATLLLLRGRFPHTPRATVEAIGQAAPAGDPLRDVTSFVLGEGSKIARTPAAQSLARGMRFVVALGAGSNSGPDVVISAPGPDFPDVELMAWDRRRGGFNFYRTVGAAGAWVWAGNSRHALEPPTRAKGPFESHTSGAMLMKELEFPWVHWHSQAGMDIPAAAFATGDDRRTHDWFTQKSGAQDCELQVAIPSIDRWAVARFEQIVGADGTIANPRRVLEQVLGTPTVNIVSSAARSDGDGPVGLPPSFFADARTLDALGLPKPGPFAVDRDVYQRSLDTLGVVLRGNDGFEQPGDTFLAFAVPERAFEDFAALREAIRVGLITRRLAATLTMVDVANPVFSDRRERLLAHVPQTATLSNGASTFSQELADAIVAAAPATPAGSPEREFAELWGEGEGGDDAWRAAFTARLERYYAAVATRLAEPDGLEQMTLLAASRRELVGERTRLFENQLLFPEMDVEAGVRRVMGIDGSVMTIDKGADDERVAGISPAG